jgi:hypothetical protein
MRQAKFINKTPNFIETGSYIGIGIDLALQSGFEKVYSIELFDEFYILCKDKFKDNTKVEIIHGDSFYELEKLLNSKPDVPFTYWLDGHFSGEGTGHGILETPLIKELEVILSRNVDGELIYVDDMRLYRNFDDDINIAKIKELLLKYKPNATVWYESSIHDPTDILCISY